MKDIRSLEQTLAQHLSWHKAPVRFVAAFMLALVTARTVNLVQLASVNAGFARQDAKYKKLQRCFRHFELPLADIADLVVKLPGVEGAWTLSLDRTNWKSGKVEINLLVLGIVHQGGAFPIVWLNLDKARNSNTDERILMMAIFLDLFGKERIARLVADREFVGNQWLCWLREQGIHFSLRVKENFQVTNARGQQVPVYKLFRSTRVSQPLIIAPAAADVGRGVVLQRLLSGQGRILDSGVARPGRKRGGKLRQTLGHRNFVCGAARRILSGTNAPDRPSPVRKVAGLTGPDVLPVPQTGRVGAYGKGAQAQKTWQQTQIHLLGFDKLSNAIANFTLI